MDVRTDAVGHHVLLPVSECSVWSSVPLVNTEVIEMIRLAQLWQTGPVDTAMAFGFGQGALVNTEKPRYSAAGKHCASPSDRSPSTLGQEAPGTVQLGS